MSRPQTKGLDRARQPILKTDARRESVLVTKTRAVGADGADVVWPRRTPLHFERAARDVFDHGEQTANGCRPAGSHVIDAVLARPRRCNHERIDYVVDIN